MKKFFRAGLLVLSLSSIAFTAPVLEYQNRNTEVRIWGLDKYEIRATGEIVLTVNGLEGGAYGNNLYSFDIGANGCSANVANYTNQRYESFLHRDDSNYHRTKRSWTPPASSKRASRSI